MKNKLKKCRRGFWGGVGCLPAGSDEAYSTAVMPAAVFSSTTVTHSLQLLRAEVGKGVCRSSGVGGSGSGHRSNRGLRG